jgi:hypothetical protein
MVGGTEDGAGTAAGPGAIVGSVPMAIAIALGDLQRFRQVGSFENL